MSPNFHLIIHNVTMIVSAIMFLGAALFSYLNGPKERANIVFSLVLFSGVIFTISHLIGVNVSDPILSKNILMFNLVVFFAGVVQVHATMALLGIEKEKAFMLKLFYFTGFGLIFFFIIFPDLLLLPSVPKMYFPNYYEPGALNILRVIFLDFIAIPYSVYLLLYAWHKSKSEEMRNKYFYFAITVISAYYLLAAPHFLVYDIEIDPLWVLLVIPGFLIPFLYVAIKYQIFNIKIIAKQAFVYSLSVVLIGGLIILLNYSTVLIQIVFPAYPYWVTALISSILAVTMAVLIWRNMRQNDILKYEFITTVTHKFRTPLTHIKWASENLSKAENMSEVKEQLAYIQNANTKLVDLTDILVQASGSNIEEYNYRRENTDISKLTRDVLASLHEQTNVGHLSISENLASDAWAKIDIARIKFVIQVLIENAVHYTPDKGSIDISVKKESGKVLFCVKDSGVGMSKDDISKLFSKFYRGAGARSIDTEGMGIGLFISREIILRHRGKIWAQSEGPGKGSTFYFSLSAI